MELTLRKKLWKLGDVLGHKMTFAEAARLPCLRLYAGDIPADSLYESEGLIGLSIKAADWNTIKHDITRPFPLADNSVYAFQAEDVLEHIPYGALVPVLNEICRILKPGACFRLSVPDYGCDVYASRCQRSADGTIVFDPGGGGWYRDGKPGGGGHLWFPTYEQVQALVTASDFARADFLHYYDTDGTPVTRPIDYARGYIQRTPDHDARVQDPYRPLSLVVDLYKQEQP